MSTGCQAPVSLKTTIGRADLAWLLSKDHSEAQRDAFIRLCGFAPAEVGERQAPPTAAAGPGEPIVPLPPLADAEPPEGARLGFWRIARADLSADEDQPRPPDWFDKGRRITRKFLQKAKKQPLEQSFPYLSPWARLWPFLRRQLSVAVPGRAVDMPELVRHIAGYRPIRRLPRRPVLRWANAIHLLLDTCEPMRPFFTDMADLSRRLEMICGRHRLRRFVFPQGLAARGYPAASGGGPVALVPYRVPEQPAAVLALSDLGALTADRSVLAWAEAVGRDLARSGSRALALVPCPSGRWPARPARGWNLVWWDLGRRLQVAALQRTDSREAPAVQPLAGPGLKPEGLEEFLRLVSPVVRPDPELIRHIRVLLPAGRTDAGMESDIWLQRLDWRARLSEFAKVPPALRQQLAKLLVCLHGDFPEILAVELTRIKSIIRDVDPQLKAYFARHADDTNSLLAASCYPGGWQAEGFSPAEGPGFMRRWEGFLPEENAYTDERVAATWVLAHCDENGQLDTNRIPPGLKIDDVAWALNPGKRQLFRLAQIGHCLGLAPEGQIMASPLGLLPSSTRQVFISPLEGRKSTKARWSFDHAGPAILTPVQTGRGFRVEAFGTVLELEQIAKPAWAREMGRDRAGLFMTLQDGRRFYWLAPGPHAVNAEGAVKKAFIQQGFWLPEQKFRDYLESGFLPQDWEYHLGEDRFGLYEKIAISGVDQVFRWIAPGRFLMGSPLGEPERLDNEVQHEVELSRGYWLADTACTQAMWEAVMGSNPSRLKGAERPVENVSWQDSRDFIDRINAAMPGLDLRLPSEAQWEYACRAGTRTPFWFGETINPEQVNYNGNYPYAGGKKGQYREQTVEVKALPPNGWGLYQMHGNVWEWCADWYGPYAQGPSIDPIGPDEGGARVLRGGSWVNNARFCRSAYRSHDHPGFSYGIIGLRLSRGQEGRAGAQAAPRSAKGTGAAAAPRGRFSEKLFETLKKKK